MSPATTVRRSTARDGARRMRQGGGTRCAGRQVLLEEELAHAARPLPAESREERPRSSAALAPAGAGGGRLTLGEVIADAWEGLLAAGSAPCPVCGGLMERPGPAGRCRGCGSRLS